jgi:D-alanine--poly(phosphoribitol) ligase subunit 2
MSENQKVLDTIYRAVDDVNLQVDPNSRLDKSPQTILFGQSSKLDSFGLVSLIVAVEQGVQEDFGVAVAIADEKAFSQKNSPFRTIGSLAEYITTLLGEKI